MGSSSILALPQFDRDFLERWLGDQRRSHHPSVGDGHVVGVDPDDVVLAARSSRRPARLGVAGLGLEVVEVDRDAAQELVADQPLGLLAVRPDVEDAAGVDQRAVLGPVDGVDPADDHRVVVALGGLDLPHQRQRQVAGGQRQRREVPPVAGLHPDRGEDRDPERRAGQLGRDVAGRRSGASTPAHSAFGRGHQRRVVDHLVGGEQLGVEEPAALAAEPRRPTLLPVAGPGAGHLVVQLGAVALGHVRAGHVLLQVPHAPGHVARRVPADLDRAARADGPVPLQLLGRRDVAGGVRDAGDARRRSARRTRPRSPAPRRPGTRPPWPRPRPRPCPRAWCRTS